MSCGGNLRRARSQHPPGLSSITCFHSGTNRQVLGVVRHRLALKMSHALERGTLPFSVETLPFARNRANLDVSPDISRVKCYKPKIRTVIGLITGTPQVDNVPITEFRYLFFSRTRWKNSIKNKRGR